MDSRLSSSLSTLLVACLILSVIPALANDDTQTIPTDSRVVELVERAREQRRAGDFDAAIASLKTALGIQTAPWLIYSLGRVYEDAKRYDLARGHYELCVGVDVDPETRTRAIDGLARLDKVGEHGRLVLRVTPANAELRIDGEPWRLDADSSTSLTAGTHRISLSHPEHEPEEQTIQIVGGQRNMVTVVLAPKRERPAAGVVAPAPVTSFDAGPWPWVTLGVGVASGVAGMVSFLDGEGDWDEIDSAPERGVFLTETEADSLRTSGREKRTIGFVAMGVGGALIATSVVLFVLDSPSQSVAWSPTLEWTMGGVLVGVGGTL